MGCGKGGWQLYRRTDPEVSFGPSCRPSEEEVVGLAGVRPLDQTCRCGTKLLEFQNTVKVVAKLFF